MTINHFEMELARLLLREAGYQQMLQIAAPVMAQRPLAKSRPSGLSQA